MNDFEGTSPVEGLEHLGRAIVDANGMPSGSPANYENLRGLGEAPVQPEDVVHAVESILAENPKPKG